MQSDIIESLLTLSRLLIGIVIERMGYRPLAEVPPRSYFVVPLG
jgi:hypothetical protein